MAVKTVECSPMGRVFNRISNAVTKAAGRPITSIIAMSIVKINGGTIAFSFKGKKGIHHSITLKNKRLAKIVKACRDIPGKELFQYMNENGVRCTVDSGMVNNYIKEATGNDFTAKDFRTWAGSLTILSCFKNLGLCDNEAQIKRNIS